MLLMLLFMSCPYRCLDDFKEKTSTNKNICVVNDDCEVLNYCILNECHHKRYFPPTQKELVGSLMIFFASALTNAAGIGGGGMMAPITSFFLKFTHYESVFIAKLMILSGSITALLLGIRKRRPYKEKSAIEFNLVILLVPINLFGTTLGVIIDQFLPTIMTYLLLSLFIGFNFVRTFLILVDMYRKEEADQAMKDTEADLAAISKSETARFKNLINYELKKDLWIFPFHKMVYSYISLVILIMMTLLKGSKSIKSIIGIEHNSFNYWLIELTLVPITLGITFIVAKNIKREHKYRKSIGYQFHPSDINWNQKTITNFCVVGLVTGLIAGMLGIGGGLILVPLLLSIGVDPIVATSTSTTVVIFESSSVTIQYIVLGKVNADYALICSLVSATGSFVGTTIVQQFAQKTGKKYVFVCAVATCLFISTSISVSRLITQILN